MLRVPLDRGHEGMAVLADGDWPAKQGRDALNLQRAVGHTDGAGGTHRISVKRGSGNHEVWVNVD